MKPSELIEQIENLQKEINSHIERLVTDKQNPQLMDIDLLNQKLINIYDLSLKLRYNLNVGDMEVSSETNNLEYFHFEPKTSHFIIEPEEQVIAEEKIEEPIEEIHVEKEIITPKVKEIPKEETVITQPEPIEETIAESENIQEVSIVEEEEDSHEEYSEPESSETPYWSVDTGWIKPIEGITEPAVIEEITTEPAAVEKTIAEPEVVEEIAKEPEIVAEITAEPEPEIIKEIVPAPAKVEEIIPEPVQQPIEPVEVKSEPNEKKPIFETISKPERSLNEMMAENKEKSVLNETQKLAFTDFKSAITLNLKISFIRELFQGNEKDYKRMIDFLNKCENYSEARLYMQGEKEKHPEWEAKQDLINHLQEIISRKFL